MLDDLTDDAITGAYRILQRRRGHRYSIDDVLTAATAARRAPLAERCLDLGTGVGSVLLMLAYKLPAARFWAVEAQAVSHALLVQNVARNGLAGRVTHALADLRFAVGRPPFEGPFDLITGTPPYVPPGSATPASDPQRAYARQEYRGGVEAYLDAAAKVLAPGGEVVLCADGRAPRRVRSAAAGAGLAVIERTDMLAKADKPAPLFSVFVLRDAAGAGGDEVMHTFVARHADGTRTQAYLDLRTFFDLPHRASAEAT